MWTQAEFQSSFPSLISLAITWQSCYSDFCSTRTDALTKFKDTLQSLSICDINPTQNSHLSYWLKSFSSTFTSLRCLRLETLYALPPYYKILANLPPSLQYLQLHQISDEDELEHTGNYSFPEALNEVIRKRLLPKKLRRIHIRVTNEYGESGGELAMFQLDKHEVQQFKRHGIEIVIVGSCSEEWDPLELLAELRLE